MLTRPIRRRLADERGLSMIVVMGAMLVITTLSAAAFAASNGDIGLSRLNQDSKDAYAAAEAGVADYLYHLNQDNGYWAKCTNVPSPNAVWQNGTARKWRMVPGASSQYSIEILPANGYAQCIEGNQDSVIDNTTETFRIRVTGQARGAKRTIVGTFKPRRFLDFLYFTDLETRDPSWYETDTQGRPIDPDLVTWASSNCAQKYWRQGRGSLLYSGSFTDGLDPETLSTRCTEIQFANADVIAGPFHTNDEILTCGTPDFGRNAQDTIEVSGPSPGWRRSSGCSGSPNFIGTFLPSSPTLTLPSTSTSLRDEVLPAYKYTGRTTIVLNGTSMNVTNTAAGLSNASVPLPENGVVYVANGECGQGYRPLDPYNAPEGCADLYVSGTYDADLTIASEKDIIIDGDIIRNSGGDAMLGLIANNFIRIYHPVTNRSASNPTQCTNDTRSLVDVRVDAAILALQHSFTVDNYYCGAPLGTLTINGAIAQKFRGPVGRGSGGQPVNGYVKLYTYDDRFRFRNPPKFLDPVQTAWRVARFSEQIPAQ